MFHSDLFKRLSGLCVSLGYKEVRVESLFLSSSQFYQGENAHVCTWKDK